MTPEAADRKNYREAVLQSAPKWLRHKSSPFYQNQIVICPFVLWRLPTLPRMPLLDARPEPDSSPPIHFGFLNSGFDCIHLGVSIVSTVFFILFPRRLK